MKKILVLNPENVREDEGNTYPVREAARAVIIDGEGNVALLHASLKNYYKLPGGGLEDGEDVLIALERECKEEIGCAIRLVGEVGIVTEFRKMFNLKQISYCYAASIKGEKGHPTFTEEELKDGFEIVWLPYGEALQTVAQSVTDDKEATLYIIPRDTAVLQAAESLFK